MKQTAEQMVAAIQAFEKDGKIEYSDDGGKTWGVTTKPSWNFINWMYRPVKVPIVTKYLCYENRDGGLDWFLEGGYASNCYYVREYYTRVPELDKEVTR